MARKSEELFRLEKAIKSGKLKLSEETKTLLVEIDEVDNAIKEFLDEKVLEAIEDNEALVNADYNFSKSKKSRERYIKEDMHTYTKIKIISKYLAIKGPGTDGRTFLRNILGFQLQCKDAERSVLDKRESILKGYDRLAEENETLIKELYRQIQEMRELHHEKRMEYINLIVRREPRCDTSCQKRN